MCCYVYVHLSHFYFPEQILMEEDLAKDSQVPWYQPLDPNHFSLSTLRLTPIGRFFTHNMVFTLTVQLWCCIAFISQHHKRRSRVGYLEHTSVVRPWIWNADIRCCASYNSQVTLALNDEIHRNYLCNLELIPGYATLICSTGACSGGLEDCPRRKHSSELFLGAGSVRTCRRWAVSSWNFSMTSYLIIVVEHYCRYQLDLRALKRRMFSSDDFELRSVAGWRSSRLCTSFWFGSP